MLRRSFIAFAAGLSLVPRAALALPPAPSPQVGDVVPPTESAWRALLPGTVVERVSSGERRDYDARWVFVRRKHPDLVGSYCLAWGGAHAGAMPWRDIEQRGVDHHVVVAVGVHDDERAIADAVDHRCSVVEREWALYVWQRRWEPERGPRSASEIEAMRKSVRNMFIRRPA